MDLIHGVREATTPQEYIVLATSRLNAESKEMILAGIESFKEALEKFGGEFAKAYFHASPQAVELFGAWDSVKQERTGAVSIRLTRLLGQLLNTCSASPDAAVRMNGMTMAKTIVRNNLKHIYSSLSSGNNSILKPCLSLLTALVRSGTMISRDLLSTMDFNHKHLNMCVEKRSSKRGRSSKGSKKQEDEGDEGDEGGDAEKASKDVRDYYVEFALSFLKIGDPTSAESVVGLKSFLKTIFKGLVYDRWDLAYDFLSTIFEHVLSAPTLSRSHKRTFFDSYVIEQLVKLLDCDHEKKQELALEFLREICCAPAPVGYCHARAGTSPFKVAVRLMRSLKAVEDTKQQDLLMDMLKANSTLTVHYFRSIPASFDVRPSTKWFGTMTLSAHIMSAIPYSVDSRPLNARSSGNDAEGTAQTSVKQDSDSYVRALWLDAIAPLGLTKAVLSSALQHSNAMVKYTALVVLGAMMERAQAASQLLPCDAGNKAAAADRSRRIRDSLCTRVPDLQIVYAVRQALAPPGQAPEDISEDAPSMREMMGTRALHVLRMYQKVLPDVFAAARFDLRRLVNKRLPLLPKEEQNHLISLLASASASAEMKWFTSSGLELSTFGIVLELMVTTDNVRVYSAARDLSRKVMKDSGHFDEDFSEIGIWLESVSVRSANFLSRVMANTAMKAHTYIDVLATTSSQGALLKLPFSPVVIGMLEYSEYLKRSQKLEDLSSGLAYMRAVLTGIGSRMTDRKPLIRVLARYSEGRDAGQSMASALSTFFNYVAATNEQSQSEALDAVINDGSTAAISTLSPEAIRNDFSKIVAACAQSQDFIPLTVTLRSFPDCANFLKSRSMVSWLEQPIAEEGSELTNFMHAVPLSLLFTASRVSNLFDHPRIQSMIFEKIAGLQVEYRPDVTRMVLSLVKELATADSVASHAISFLFSLLEYIVAEEISSSSAKAWKMESCLSLVLRNSLWKSATTEEHPTTFVASAAVGVVNFLLMLDVKRPSQARSAISSLLNNLLGMFDSYRQQSEEAKDTLIVILRRLIPFYNESQGMTIIHKLLYADLTGESAEFTLFLSVLEASTKLSVRMRLSPSALRRIARLSADTGSAALDRAMLSVLGASCYLGGIVLDDEHGGKQTRMSFDYALAVETDCAVRWLGALSTSRGKLLGYLCAHNPRHRVRMLEVLAEKDCAFLDQSELSPETCNFAPVALALLQGEAPGDNGNYTTNVTAIDRLKGCYTRAASLLTQGQKIDDFGDAALGSLYDSIAKIVYVICGMGNVTTLLPSLAADDVVVTKVRQKNLARKTCELRIAEACVRSPHATALDSLLLLKYAARSFSSLLTQISGGGADPSCQEFKELLLDGIILACGQLFGKSNSELAPVVAQLGDSLEKIVNKFIKSVLKHSYEEAEAIRALTLVYHVMQKVQPGIMRPASVNEMVVSHSRFRAAITRSDGIGEDTQCNLAVLLRLLNELDPACCQPFLLPVLLSSYNGSLSRFDLAIKPLLEDYETRGRHWSRLGFVWGTASIKLVESTTGNVIASNDRVYEDMINSRRVWKTIESFPSPPSRRAITEIMHEMCTNTALTDKAGEDPDIFDPFAVFAFFLQSLTASGQFDSKKFTESGGLALVVSSLSAPMQAIRQLGYEILAKFLDTVMYAKDFRERQQIILILTILKESVQEAYQQFPTPITSFVARATRVLIRPDHKIYGSINKFLLRNDNFNLDDIPMFYNLFHSGNATMRDDRAWMLDVLSNGIRSPSDLGLFKRRHVLEMIMSLYSSETADARCRRAISKCLNATAKVRRCCIELCERLGVLAWIRVQIENISSQEEMLSLVQLLSTLQDTLQKTKRNGLEDEFSLVLHSILDKVLLWNRKHLGEAEASIFDTFLVLLRAQSRWAWRESTTSSKFVIAIVHVRTLIEFSEIFVALRQRWMTSGKKSSIEENMFSLVVENTFSSKGSVELDRQALLKTVHWCLRKSGLQVATADALVDVDKENMKSGQSRMLGSIQWLMCMMASNQSFRDILCEDDVLVAFMPRLASFVSLGRAPLYFQLVATNILLHAVYQQSGGDTTTINEMLVPSLRELPMPRLRPFSHISMLTDALSLSMSSAQVSALATVCLVARDIVASTSLGVVLDYGKSQMDSAHEWSCHVFRTEPLLSQGGKRKHADDGTPDAKKKRVAKKSE